MAEYTGKKCDVFGTLKNVRRFGVVIRDVADNNNVYENAADLSPRALERLLKFVRRGISPPTPTERKTEK